MTDVALKFKQTEQCNYESARFCSILTFNTDTGLLQRITQVT